MNIHYFSRSVVALCLSLASAPLWAAPAKAPVAPVKSAPLKSATPVAKTPAQAVPQVAATPTPLPYVPPLAEPTLESAAATLANGLTLITRTDRLAPRVAISLLIKAGAADETATTAGWRRLLADAMLRGSKDAAGAAMKGADVQRAAEKLGGRSGATVSDDAIEFWAIGDSAHQGELLDLVLQMALRPRLAEDDVDAARDLLQSNLDAESGNVPAQAVNTLRDQLYRNEENAPAAYGLPGSGSEESLKALSGVRLRALHQLFFQPSQMTLAAVGDVDTPTLRASLEKLKKTEAAPGEIEAALPHPGTLPRLVPPAKDKPPLIVRQLPLRDATPTAWLFVGFAGPGASSADLPALRVLSAALGEMPRSRLEKRLLSTSLIPGLEDPTVIQAAAQWTPRRYSGELVVFAQTRAQNIESIKNALLDEINKLRDASLTAPELERAKNFTRGGWAVEHETLRDRAFQAAFAPAAGAPADIKWPSQVAAVSAADVRRVAQKYLQNYAVTLVLPED